MIKKTDTCAHCGAAIGPAHLWVSRGSVGPTGLFCLPTDCYGEAWKAHRGRLAGPPVGEAEPGGMDGAGEAGAHGRPNLGPLA